MKNKILSITTSKQAIGIATILLASFFMYAGSVRAEGTTYYIDAVNGNDINSGTSENTAWQTIDKVNATALDPGDSILFKRGDKFRGRIQIQSGLENQKITYGAYGIEVVIEVVLG